MSAPAVISVAPNGARRTHRDHPGIPLSAEDIAYEAAKCRNAGASLIHVHVRDAQGGHLLDAEAYQDVIRAIEREVGHDLIVQITTEAVGKYAPAEQIAVVKAVKPEAASVAICEVAADDGALAEAEDFFHWMAREGVLAQYILYTPDEVRRFNDLRARGVIPDAHPLVLFVLGSYAGGPGNTAELGGYLAALEEGAPAQWGVCAFGVTEAQAARWALAHGGHPRVGFENNLMLEDGSVARTNADLVRQTVEDAEAYDRPIAGADDARALFHGELGSIGSGQTWKRQGATGG